MPNLAHILSIVNAPYTVQLTAPELAHALTDLDLAKKHSGQVSSFFGEVSVADQLAFAAAHGIAPEALKAASQQFSEWSGEHYCLIGLHQH